MDKDKLRCRSDEAIVAYNLLPVRTWRYLDVNEGKITRRLLKKPPRRGRCYVKSGASDHVTRSVNRGGRDIANIAVAEGAVADYTVVLAVPDEEEIAVDFRARVAQKGFLRVNIALLSGRRHLSRYEIELIGDDSQAEINLIYFGTGEEIYDLNCIIRQRGKNTQGRMNVYGALADKADKVFRGTLDFVRGCTGAKGCGREEVLILSEGVRSRTVPLLLSGEKEAAGHHAVNIGRLDDNKLRDFASRSEAEAKHRLLTELFSPVLDRIADPAVRAEADAVIAAKEAALF